MATHAEIFQATTPRPRALSRAVPATAPNDFHDATRVQHSLTAPLERKALAWLARRIPSWVNSDHLTLLGFAAMFLAGASYALAQWNRAGLLLATVCLALNWFGDSLDGTVARLRNRQRPRYGFYVDHIIDTIGGLFLMGGLALSGYIDWWIALGMYVGFLILSVETYLAAYALRTFHLSCARMGPTEIRLLLALGNVVLWIHPDVRVAGTPYRLFDVGGIVAIVGMTAMTGFLSIRHTAQLYREETLR
jgi:phosphatidylglycerophosphate synthase